MTNNNKKKEITPGQICYFTFPPGKNANQKPPTKTIAGTAHIPIFDFVQPDDEPKPLKPSDRTLGTPELRNTPLGKLHAVKPGECAVFIAYLKDTPAGRKAKKENLRSRRCVVLYKNKIRVCAELKLTTEKNLIYFR